MKNKKWLLILIIIIPSVLWVVLESSTINSRKLPYYGPKKIVAKGDTSYYSVTDEFFQKKWNDTLITKTKINVGDFPLYAIMFIKSSYINDSYRLVGLWEYLNYKNDKIQNIPIFLVTELDNQHTPTQDTLLPLCTNKNVRFLAWHKSSFDSISSTYFNKKPIYIDKSFFVLIDENRHIRGYYDGRYVAELKRLIDEYRHLRLKEAKQKLIDENTIKKNS
jgi:hypothetical protein